MIPGALKKECPMRRPILYLTPIAIFILVVPAQAAPLENRPELQVGTAYDVINNINNYRAANGLPTLAINDTLMGTAQQQANYQASTGTVTHTGSGGTTPKDRAIAAGYGGGSNIFLSEIIYGGMTATSDAAMEWWKNSSVHNTVMLTSTYSEVGAAVASNDTSTYFTAVLASVAGGTYTGGTTSSSGSSAGDSSSSSKSADAVAVPVTKADPRQDGSIVHQIQNGQALWTLSIIYEVDLQTLLDLNNLPETALVFPGDEILIQAAYTPTPTLPVTPTSPPTSDPLEATATLPASETELNITAVSADTAELAQAQSAPKVSENTVSPTVRWIVILAFAILFGVVVGSMFMQRMPQRPEDDDVVR